MTQEEIIRMAREAGLNIPDRRNDLWMPQLERFAALVAEATKLQSQGEPVAWRFDWYSEDENKWYTSHTSNFDKTVSGEVKTRNVVPLYTTPPSVEAMRIETLEKAAKVCEQGTGNAVQTGILEVLLQERGRIAAAIRSMK